MDKIKYQKPELYWVKLEDEDIITTSNDGEWDIDPYFYEQYFLNGSNYFAN